MKIVVVNVWSCDKQSSVWENSAFVSESGGLFLVNRNVPLGSAHASEKRLFCLWLAILDLHLLEGFTSAHNAVIPYGLRNGVIFVGMCYGNYGPNFNFQVSVDI